MKVGLASNIKVKWNVDLVASNRAIGNLGIRRSIFQGDSLSPLLSYLY